MAEQCDDPWYHEAGEPETEAATIAQGVASEVKKCRDMLRERRRADLVHLRLVYGPDLAGLGDADPLPFVQERARSRWNVCAAAVETAASLIASSKPTPMYLTIEGDFGAMRRARLATKAIGSLFNELRVHSIAARCFVDANTASLGVIHGSLCRKGRPQLERVNPFELLIDPTETSSSGDPLTIYRHRPYSLDMLKDEYPDLEDELEEAPRARSAEDRVALGIPAETATRMVMLTEAWRKAPKEGGRGRYVKCVGEVVLENKRWRHTYLPFAFFVFQPRPMGFFGQGITEMAVDTQIRINELIRRVDRLQDLGSNAWVFINESQDLQPQKITNAPMQVVKVRGEIPKMQTHSATPPDLAAQIDKEQERLLFRLGLSQSASSGERAPGVYSGAGLRATDDVQSRRMAPHVKRWEDFHMDVARLLERLCDEAARRNRDFAVDVEDNRAGSRTVARHQWVKIRAKRGEQTRMQIFPVSALPSTPQGKLSAITDWVNNGWLSQPFAMSLLEFPDTDAYARFALADMEYAMWMMEQIIEEGEVPAIPEYLDTKTASDIFRRSCLRLRMDQAPDDVIDLAEGVLESLAAMEKAFDAVTAANAPPAPVGLDPAAMAAQGIPPEQLAGMPPGPLPPAPM